MPSATRRAEKSAQDAAQGTQGDVTTSPAGEVVGGAPAVLNGLVMGDFPTIKGRGRPAQPVDAQLASELEQSLTAGYVTRTGDKATIDKVKRNATRWAKERGFKPPSMVTINSDGENTTVGLKARNEAIS